MAEHTPIHNRGPEEEKREAAVNESAEDQARRVLRDQVVHL